MKKIQFYKILFLVLFLTAWTIFIVFYDGAVVEYQSDIEGANYSFYRILFYAVINSLIGGTVLASVEVLYLSKLLRKIPFGLTLLIKAVIYIVLIHFFSSIVRFLMFSSELNMPVFSQPVIDRYWDYATSPRLIFTILFWGLATVIGLFMIQVSDKFGQGVLVNFLLGRYHRPKEEERIFMFMDLKSSTPLAEKLGHVKYSRLIQDCFYDLTDVVVNYHAQIYQYVGDEVVLSWYVKDGIKNGNAVKTFFAYDKVLNKKSKYYLKKYGVIPKFKAGLHMGKVIVAEVGEIKKELAFHGDAINTTARIQERCNDFNKKVLILETLKRKLEKLPGFTFPFIGEVKLHGKIASVNLFEVKPET